MPNNTSRTFCQVRRLAMLATAGVLALSGSLAAQSEDEATVRARFDQLNDAFSARDLETVYAMYTDNMVRIPPGQPAVVGLDAFREQMAAALEETDYVLDEYEVRRIEVSGDLAYILATYTEHFTPKAGGETTYSSGRWATMWHRQSDGSWKVAAEIWNLAPEDG